MRTACPALAGAAADFHVVNKVLFGHKMEIG
jgi:hypothetical protein